MVGKYLLVLNIFKIGRLIYYRDLDTRKICVQGTVVTAKGFNIFLSLESILMEELSRLKCSALYLGRGNTCH